MRKFLQALLLVCVGSSVAAAQQGPYSGVGAGSVPPEKVARYAPPPLAPEVARRIQAMLDVRAPGLGAAFP